MSLISVGYLCRKFLGPEAELLHLVCLDILFPHHHPLRKRLTHLIDTAVQNWHLTFRPGLAVNGKVVGNNRKSHKGLSAGWSLRVLEHQHPLEDLPCVLACNASLFVRTAHWILLVVLIFFGILLVQWEKLPWRCKFATDFEWPSPEEFIKTTWIFDGTWS